MSNRTHYDILQVPPSATQKEIRAAYKKLVLEFHPDRSSAPDATARFVEVSDAYRTLSDPLLRKEYDERLVLERMMSQKRASPKPTSPSPTRKARVHKPPPAQNYSITAELMKLTSLLGKSRYVEAERVALSILEKDPKQAMPYAVLADIARYRGEIKKAAEMYAYAAQMDPTNQLYEKRYEELLKASADVSERGSFMSIVAALGLISTASIYIALGREAPILTAFGWVNTWTFGLLVMLFLSGLSIGASLTLGNVLERFGAAHGSAVSGVPPAILLGVIAVVNFWVAALFFLVVGASQNVFNVSISRILGWTAGATVTLTLGSSVSGVIDPTQVLLWGGNVVYIGALCGWMVADALRT